MEGSLPTYALRRNNEGFCFHKMLKMASVAMAPSSLASPL